MRTSNSAVIPRQLLNGAGISRMKGTAYRLSAKSASKFHWLRMTQYRNGSLSHGVRRDRLPADNPVAALTCHRHVIHSRDCASLTPRGRAKSASRLALNPNSGQHRTIRQEVSDRIFVPIQSLENEGILYVFLVFQAEEVGQKDGGDSQTQLCGAALNFNL